MMAGLTVARLGGWGDRIQSSLVTKATDLWEGRGEQIMNLSAFRRYKAKRKTQRHSNLTHKIPTHTSESLAKHELMQKSATTVPRKVNKPGKRVYQDSPT